MATPLISPTQKNALDNRSPVDSLRRAEYLFYTAAVASLAALTIPAVPLLPPVGVGASLYIANRLRRRRREIEKEFEGLGERRGFGFQGNRVPSRPSEKTWSPQWVPFEVRITEENGPKRQRKHLYLEQNWADVLKGRRAWLGEHLPNRVATVQSWWMQAWIQPTCLRLFGPAPADGGYTKEQFAIAGQEVEYEYEVGVAIACQKTLWGRQLGVGPEQGAYKLLIEMLEAGVPEEPKGPFPPLPVKTYPILKEFFIGRGFTWDQHHTQSFEDLKIRDVGDVKKGAKVEGDPRIFNLGYRDSKEQFIEEKFINTHVLILGSTGVGKTRYVEPLMVQAIQSNFPVWIIDPKGDAALTERACEETRRCGRGHQWRYMTLVTPRNPECYDYIATYNPLFTYGHHSELASRIGSVVASAGDKFWKSMALSLAGNCLGLCDNLMNYLCYIGMDRRTRQRMPRGSSLVPKLLLAMAWARNKVSATPAEAEIAVDQVLESMKRPTWQPNPDQRPIFDLLTQRSLSGQPQYSPIEWNPTIRQISEYELDNTTAFLGWTLKIFHNHLFLADEQMSSPSFPRTCPESKITAKSDTSSMWSNYLKSGYHPFELRFESNTSMPPQLARWKSFYDYFVPEADDPKVKAAETYWLKVQFFPEIKRLLESHYTDCVKERKEFINHSSLLTSSIKPFLSEKGRIVCSLSPDASWSKLIDENLVVYTALGSMVDPEGASGIAKMMVQDCASFIGELYNRTPERIKPFYLICDEISTFINDPMIDLLNKGRGAGARIILLGQTNADLNNTLGSADKAKMVKGNCNTTIQLRTGSLEDARDFADRTGKVNVMQQSRSTSTTPGVGNTGNLVIKEFSTNENRSYQTKEVERVPPSSLLSLDLGQAFISTRGEVIMVSQGMFADPQTRWLQECGMNEGTMYRAYPHVVAQLRDARISPTPPPDQSPAAPPSPNQPAAGAARPPTPEPPQARPATPENTLPGRSQASSGGGQGGDSDLYGAGNANTGPGSGNQADDDRPAL